MRLSDTEAVATPPECKGPPICPLSRVRAGSAVRIRQLATAPDVSLRLREIGFCEDQTIRLVACQNNVICQVCNARLAISTQLADSILVEPLSLCAAG